MRSVSIIGIGQSPVGELWEESAREIAYRAISSAMSEAGIETADALYVGNMLSGSLLEQEHLATLIADYSGLRGIEAAKVEAACASGAAALRMGVMAVASGFHDIVIVAGLEKMTDTIGKDTTAGLAQAADAEYESLHGVSFVALNALIMQRYQYEHNVPLDAFAGFSINAHRNGANNPNAMFQRPISRDTYMRAPVIATPINIMDSSPVCDGAAALVLTPTELAYQWTNGHHPGSVQILASVSATDSLAVHDRRDPLTLDAAVLSCERAFAMAGVTAMDLDLFELHDAFTIMSALSLEAAGFAKRGEGWRMAEEGRIGIDGDVPVSTMGGLKSRGHPVGATGVYQIVEVVEQLTGRAGTNQIKDARLGMAQNIGGSGATVITHILGS
ncbi:MAG: thiolase domain-containing protein [Caldilineaceae bacterium]